MEGYSITRFSSIFFGTPPAQIGPIRSARLVNYYLGAQYNSPLMCSGASDDVRYPLKNFAPFAYLDIDLDDPSNRLYTDNVGNDYRTRLRVSADGLRKWLSNWDISAPEGLRGFSFGDAPGGGARVRLVFAAAEADAPEAANPSSEPPSPPPSRSTKAASHGA